MKEWRVEGDIANRAEYQTTSSIELLQRQTEITDLLDLYLTNSEPFQGVAVEYTSDGEGLITGHSNTLDMGQGENMVAYFDTKDFAIVEVSLSREFVSTEVEAYCLAYSGRRTNGRPDFEYHVSIQQKVGSKSKEPNFTSSYTLWLWPDGSLDGRVKHLMKAWDESGQEQAQQQAEREMSVYDYRQLEKVLMAACEREFVPAEMKQDD